MSSSTSEPPLKREDDLPAHHGESAPQVQTEDSEAANHAKDVPSTPSPEVAPTQGQTVRFSSNLEEIEPAHSLTIVNTLTNLRQDSSDLVSPEASAEIQNLALSLKNSRLQHRRMSNFNFEPVSLPVSRVPSTEPSPRQSLVSSARPSASVASMHTPPLTPAESITRDGEQASTRTTSQDHPGARLSEPQITPQTSDPSKIPGANKECEESRATTASEFSRSASADKASTRHTTTSQPSRAGEDAISSKNAAVEFSVGPSDSISPSRDESPLATPHAESGTVTPPLFSRPFTPAGDRDDPYARSKRPPQSRNLDAIDARFKFGGKDSRRHSSMAIMSAAGTLPRSNSGGDLKTHDRHHSGFSLHSLGKKDHLGHLQDDSSSSLGKQHGSMADLKRFLRIGQSSHKRSQSPSSAKAALNNKSGVRTPPHQLPPANVPFADDHGLQSKYGKFGKVLGAGAGGSVRLMKRSSDGVTFAVKQFRDRHSYETEREYAKKVTAEFCIGSTLHHGNIIETLDIIHERGHWYEVMEYAPYDLFAIVMTGKMSREEVACCFLQIVAGVTYLHSMGLAHRDLKLDNVVVNDHGIMKLIDFGSAIVFKYPFENDIVLATGVVGSDPYLAPEVYDSPRYDPQPTDIWSLAIIFACMSLRRFPWKLPRTTDNSYKLFIATPTQGTPIESGIKRTSEQRPKSMIVIPASDDPRRLSASNQAGDLSEPVTGDASSRTSQRHYKEKTENLEPDTTLRPSTSGGDRSDAPPPKQEVIKGPWRLLRLLPRESRSIIGRMLEVNPKKRATLDEMLADPWISQSPVCQQLDGGQIINAPGHEHTLVPGTPETPVPSKK